MTDQYRGHEIRLSESGYSYECPNLELSAPTRLDLERAIRNVTREVAQ